MKVILKEDVDNLGIMGAVVDVSDGYGRNYLIPKKLAVEANPRNIKSFEHEKKITQEKAQKVKASQAELAQRISSAPLSVEAKAGEDGKLFGSVTGKDIAELLKVQGFDIDKRKIVLPEDSIKRIGTYTVKVKLYQDVTAEAKLDVVPSKGQDSTEG